MIICGVTILAKFGKPVELCILPSHPIDSSAGLCRALLSIGWQKIGYLVGKKNYEFDS